MQIELTVLLLILPLLHLQSAKRGVHLQRANEKKPSNKITTNIYLT